MISVISIFDLEHISELVYEISTCDFHGHQLCEITEKGQTQRFMFFAINCQRQDISFRHCQTERHFFVNHKVTWVLSVFAVFEYKMYSCLHFNVALLTNTMHKNICS